MKISKIQDSISILITLQSAIDECQKIILGENHNKNSVVHALASGQLLIYTNSFLDEWKNLGTQCKVDNQVIKVRKLASPFINRINNWDLHDVRNIFLAHNFRDREKKNALIKHYDNELNIPSSLGDYVLLSGCVFCIKQILITEFSMEYNDLIVYLKTIKTPKIKEGINSDQLAMKELNQLINQSDLLKQES